jgi:hypothetical protein
MPPLAGEYSAKPDELETAGYRDMIFVLIEIIS